MEEKCSSVKISTLFDYRVFNGGEASCVARSELNHCATSLRNIVVNETCSGLKYVVDKIVRYLQIG